MVTSEEHVTERKESEDHGGSMMVWTRIFYVHPHSIGDTLFLFGEKLILEKSESPLILFYFKEKIK